MRARSSACSVTGRTPDPGEQFQVLQGQNATDFLRPGRLQPRASACKIPLLVRAFEELAATTTPAVAADFSNTRTSWTPATIVLRQGSVHRPAALAAVDRSRQQIDEQAPHQMMTVRQQQRPATRHDRRRSGNSPSDLANYEGPAARLDGQLAELDQIARYNGLIGSVRSRTVKAHSGAAPGEARWTTRDAGASPATWRLAAALRARFQCVHFSRDHVAELCTSQGSRSVDAFIATPATQRAAAVAGLNRVYQFARGVRRDIGEQELRLDGWRRSRRRSPSRRASSH
jgi:hypothetical protein